MYLFLRTLLILEETDISQFLKHRSLTCGKPTHPAPRKQAGSLPLITIVLFATKIPCG